MCVVPVAVCVCVCYVCVCCTCSCVCVLYRWLTALTALAEDLRVLSLILQVKNLRIEQLRNFFEPVKWLSECVWYVCSVRVYTRMCVCLSVYMCECVCVCEH